MTDAKTTEDVLPKLTKVAERAKRNPQQRILALAQYIDESALERSYRRLRKDAAVGVDGMTVEVYGQRLEENLKALRERMRAGKYRHQPIRRVHIPKENGKTRPIGISTVEDKVVQGAIREVLEAVYEQDFLECSHGFRPGRGAHDAIRALHRTATKGNVNHILEADIVSFFDSIDRKTLMEMLRGRIADETLMRLVGKCLHVGILDGEEYTEPERGTTQGSVLSPLLGNIYLHYVLDIWFEHEVKPQLRGAAELVRYADDFVICLQYADDAGRVMMLLTERLQRNGLTLHPEKTRLLTFQPPEVRTGGKGTASFNFLGFTLIWRRTLRGNWRLGCRTRKERVRSAILRAADWCRRHRHLPVPEQHTMLKRKLVGHYNYFGVNGNIEALTRVRLGVMRAWQKWLNRRSQRGRMGWKRFNELLRAHPLPAPRIAVQVWG